MEQFSAQLGRPRTDARPQKPDAGGRAPEPDPSNDSFSEERSAATIGPPDRTPYGPKMGLLVASGLRDEPEPVLLAVALGMR